MLPHSVDGPAISAADVDPLIRSAKVLLFCHIIPEDDAAGPCCTAAWALRPEDRVV
jgi:hypothetical protein